MDAPFTLRCGAALAMVPLPVVEEALRRDELPESLVENVREVANILARLLNSPSTPHLRLHALHQLPTELTPAVEALLGSPEFRRDFALPIEGSGNGRLSLLAASSRPTPPPGSPGPPAPTRPSPQPPPRRPGFPRVWAAGGR